jgi:hypothetical protein
MSVGGKSWSLAFYDRTCCGGEGWLGSVTLSPALVTEISSSKITLEFAQVTSDTNVESLSEVVIVPGETG